LYEFAVIDVEVRYIDETGRPLTMQEFVDRLLRQLPGLFGSADELRAQWADPDQRESLMTKLGQAGFDQEQLVTLRKMFAADACDLFDLLAFLAFEQPMTTRHDRAQAVRERQAFFAQFGQEKAKHFLDFVLKRYEDTGSSELARERLPTLIELSGMGTIKDASQAFGGKPALLLNAFRDLQHQLYYAV
jgi:type I restriction enzyme R subunit